MVLGLIDFLLGGKKKTKIPKNAQATTAPMSKVGQANATDGTQNAGADAQAVANENAQENTNANQEQPAVSTGPKKSVSDMISMINKELKSTTDTLANVSSDMKEIKNTVSSLDKRVNEIEKKNTALDDKVVDIDDNMSKFLSLYELVNDQYNPFVESKANNINAKEIIINNQGEGSIVGGENPNSENFNTEDIQNIDINNQECFNAENHQKAQVNGNTVSNNGNNYKNTLETSLLELDTLDIEEAAADAVPLTKLKNNTNSLVIILSWLEYFVKKVGVEESKNTLRYYTETLKWITPEVYFELEKYLRGMKDSLSNETTEESLNVKDHIVSLYFISKLNEKVLDERLTKAVLEIIKQ